MSDPVNALAGSADLSIATMEAVCRAIKQWSDKLSAHGGLDADDHKVFLADLRTSASLLMSLYDTESALTPSTE